MRVDNIKFFKEVPLSDDVEVLSFDNVIVIEYWDDCLDVYCDDGLPCHCVDFCDFDYFIVRGEFND